MKKDCPYCGNNQVSHRIFWYNESLNILMTPVRQKVLYNPYMEFFKNNGLGQKLALFFLDLGITLKLITLQTDPKKCKVRRAQVLWEEAEKRGIKMSELMVFGKAVDTYLASLKTEGLKDKTIVFSGLPRPAGYSNKWLDLMDDKWLFKQAMMKNNLPVPLGESVVSLDQAEKVFEKLQKPVIVKPRAGSRGRHSTTFVYHEDDLKKAYNVAKQLCLWVMVEEQLFGPVYRATLINFELCGVLKGESPQITGDGKSSIEELIKGKNSHPHLGVKDIVISGQMEDFLSRQNLTLKSVLPVGKILNLSEKIGVSYGGYSREDFDICHPDNKELFVKAAKILEDPIVGFDFIIPDISKSFKEQHCGFLEVNSLPFINLHHDPLMGQPRNVAVKIWEMLGW